MVLLVSTVTQPCQVRTARKEKGPSTLGPFMALPNKGYGFPSKYLIQPVTLTPSFANMAA